MCCCGKPVVNGEPGYRWQPNDVPSIRRTDAPTLDEGDVLLFDEPGRCGGIDSHCHHYRVVVKNRYLELLVQHGAGQERITLTDYSKTLQGTLDAMDSNARYWLLNVIFGAQRKAATNARECERHVWTLAAAEKRIKTRKQPKRGLVKVWIEPATATK